MSVVSNQSNKPTPMSVSTTYTSKPQNSRFQNFHLIETDLEPDSETYTDQPTVELPDEDTDNSQFFD